MESEVDGAEKPAVHLKRLALFMAYLLYVIVVPHRLYDVYMTDGLSLRFAHFALAAFVLALILVGLSEWIGIDAVMILMIPAVIGFIATYEWNIVSCITMIVTLFFVIIFLVVLVNCCDVKLLVSCDKNGDVEDIPLPVTAKEVSCDKNCDVEDIPLPATAKEVSCDKNGDVKVLVNCDENGDVMVLLSCDKNGDVKDIPLSLGAKEENV